MAEKGVEELKKLDIPLEIVNLDNGDWVKQKIEKGRYLKDVSIPKILNQVDKLIYLPCCKTHFLAQYTGALKLAVGLIRPKERMRLHMKKAARKNS